MKEKITRFNLEDAFKALDEIEVPKVKGIRPNKPDLKESCKRVDRFEALFEDYYNVQDQNDLEEAKESREEEVAQAKLARIEKIVDLDAETAEDLLPSYVGKVIVQCPQCMTLFYKDSEDIEKSEEDETIANVGEVCQHCGNDSGYTIIGKVAAEEVEETPVEEEAIEEPAVEEESAEEEVEEPTEEAAEENEEELSLDEIPDEEVEEEVKESLNNSEFQKDCEEESELKTEIESEHLSLNEKVCPVCGDDADEPCEDCKKELEEDIDSKELTKKLDEYSDYIKELQDEIKEEELAIKNTKNEFIKKMHEDNLEALNAALDKAIPEEVKAEAAIEELPTAEDAAEDMTKNESLNEGVEAAKSALNDFINNLDEGVAEERRIDNYLELLPESCNESFNNEEFDRFIAACKALGFVKMIEVENFAKEHGDVKNQDLLKALEDEVEKRKNKSLKEDVSDAEFEAMLDNPIYNEGLEEEKCCEDQCTIHKAITHPEEDMKELKEEKEEEVEEVSEEEIEEVKEELPVEEVVEKIEEVAEEIKEVVEADEEVEEAIDEVVEEKVEEICPECKDEELEEENFDDVDEIVEESLNEHISKFFTEVYKNVESFKASSCEMNGNKLMIEGVITFKSGKTKETMFEFVKDGKHFYGENKSLTESGDFDFDYSIKDNALIVENFKYSYKIDNNLVEGFTRK